MIEEDGEFFCPYCDVRQTIRLDATGGTHQEMVTDCEICCQPIIVNAFFENGQFVEISVEREND